MAIFLAGLVFLYAPYAHNAKLKETIIAQDEARKLQQPVIKDDGSQAIISDLRQQLIERNFDIQELKRRIDKEEQTASRSSSENAALNNRLRDLQGKLTGKVARQAHSEKIAAFLDAGEAIKRKCFLGSDTPRQEAVEWHNQVLSYLKTTMDSAHVIRFKNTRSPDAKMHYFLPDMKLVAKECNDNAQEMDTKLEVLRDFLSELST